MNFSMKDIALITTMSGAIIFMSFLFPALGLADGDETATEDDIPEFNISSSQFDIAGEFPDNPGTPSHGELTWDESLSGGGDDNYLWLQGDASSGFQTTIVTADQTNVEADLAVYDSSTLQHEDNYTFSSEGEEFTLEYDANISGFDVRYAVDYRVTEYDNPGEHNFTTTVEYQVQEQPSGDAADWISRIPIIGGILSAGDEIAAMVGWIGSIIWWATTFIFEISLTIILILVEVMVFSVSLMQWLLGSYFSIVTAAGSWASVVLMLPGIMLFLEFAKLAMLGIKLLPTT